MVDKFGVSWQIAPKILGDLLGDADRTKADRALQAMLKMVKFDIATSARTRGSLKRSFSFDSVAIDYSVYLGACVAASTANTTF